MSGCACGIDIDLDCCDVITAFGEPKMRKARKAHLCDECKDPIRPGARYERAVWKERDSGEIVVHRTCEDCLSIRNAFFCSSYYYGCVRVETMEYIHDEGGNIPSACIVPLTEAAKDWVCAVIEEAWKDGAE